MIPASSNGLVLVTGGSGYIAGYCIAQLLQDGWRVRTTVRSLAKAEQVRSSITKISTGAAAAIEFFEADLNSDQGWDRAVAGADYVLHVASPVTVIDPKSDDELVRPARDGALELVTINPSLVIGPVLGRDFSASLEVVKKLLDHSLPALPRIGFDLVDVRDIARLHILGMTTPSAAGQRFIGSGDYFWMKEIASVLKQGLGEKALKVPSLVIPDFLVRVLRPGFETSGCACLAGQG
jgi:nucleoside-diphosphate-sugar epimerase